MNSRMASGLLSRANSIKRSKLPQLRKSILGNDSGAYEMNGYILKDFFIGENYQSILKCLDDGYSVLTDQLEYIRDYREHLKNQIESLTSFSNKWKSKINHQSTLASYNTTKQSQIEMINSASKAAQLIKKRCDEIDQVISSFRRQIDRFYPGERLGTVHKHYRSDSVKKQFKDARAPVNKASKIRDEMRGEKEKADKSLLNARSKCQELELNATTSKSAMTKANDHLEKKQRESKEADEQLDEAEEKVQREEKSYAGKAMEIYQTCRVYEAERLDLIRETLIEFVHAIHSTEHSSEQDELYAKLLTKIESQQNTEVDLNFWAEIYHVIDPMPRSNSTETIANTTTESTINKSETTATTTDVNNNSSIVEVDEPESVTEKPSTSTKNKQKKKKSTTPEPASPDVN